MRKLSVIIVSLLVILSSVIIFNPGVSAVPSRIYIHVDSVNGGNPVAGANVTLVNQAVGTELNGETDSNGDLVFDIDLGTLFNPSEPNLSFSFASYNQSIRITVEHEDFDTSSKTFAFESGQVGLIKEWVNVTMHPEENNDTPMLTYLIVGLGIAVFLIILLLIYMPKKEKKKDKKS